MNPLKNLIAPNLYKRYSSILSLSNIPLFLLDTNGDILLQLIPSPEFCTHVCQEKEGEACASYIQQIEGQKEGRFVCKHGLENILIPIIYQGETLGYMAGMQVYLKNNEYKKHMINIDSLLNSKITSVEFVARCISSLQSVEVDKIKVHEQLCKQIAKNISLDLLEKTYYSDEDFQRLSIEKEILERKIIDLEAKNMSLAVNPHFLFNTLNCIARIAYFENSYKTEELIYCLSDLLRYNLKQEDKFHTIEAEIINVEKYLYIQKVRFGNRLEYYIDVPNTIKHHKIPNMIIQPIVENALIHGVAPNRDGGKIQIYATKDRDKIVIYIEDSGKGFPEDVLKDLKSSEGKLGLGIRNTDSRLKQYYGEDYGIDIAKSDHSGSIVTITIPTRLIMG